MSEGGDDKNSTADAVSDNISDIKSKLSGIRGELKKFVKSGVEWTNGTLAVLEETSLEARKPVLAGMKQAQVQGEKVVEQSMRVYGQRHEYGPYLIGCSAFAVGGLVALRGGRLSALAATTLGGLAAYAAVYDPFPLQDLPDLVFGTSGTADNDKKD